MNGGNTMDRKEWEQLSLDDILKQFEAKHGKAVITWEGWHRITAADLKDYQGR
jgi:hypothetical protein